MLSLNLSMQGLERVREQLQSLGSVQIKRAQVNALNDSAKVLRLRVIEQLKERFDRPTPYILNSVRYFPATQGELTVRIEPTYLSKTGGKGGKLGVDPQRVLWAQEFGEKRADKKSEALLRRAGLLPAGWQTAIPEPAFPGSEDGYGNLKGPFVQQLLSYFQAYSEQGYKANMSARGKAQLQRGGARWGKGKAGPRLGRRYIVSYGKMRAGARQTAKGEYDQRASNLAPGIWAIMGPQGGSVRCVLAFVRAPKYKPRLALQGLAQSPETQELLAQKLRYHIRREAGQ